MRNHEVTTRQKLLKNGSLREPGWSKKLLQEYDRKDIRANRLRIKEWDYYLVMNKEFGIAMTLSDDGYIGLQSVSFLDFKNGWEHTETLLNILPLGKLQLPSTSEYGTSTYHDKRLDMTFEVEKGQRILRGCFLRFYEGKDLNFKITLHQPDMDSMVIATPWKKAKYAFYYNQKINCMRAEGFVQFDNHRYIFHPESDFGTLDWGRGVWTYDNTWYWGSGNMDLDGHAFGFNIGYGFGDTSAASENMLFYDGKAHKLDDVIFHIPQDHKKTWTITSSDQRFEMKFDPLLDRAVKLSALVVSTDQHQVFGYMSGTAVLDDGTRLDIQDMLCFCEFVHNRY